MSGSEVVLVSATAKCQGTPQMHDGTGMKQWKMSLQPLSSINNQRGGSHGAGNERFVS